jgi:hypothetical protein
MPSIFTCYTVVVCLIRITKVILFCRGIWIVCVNCSWTAYIIYIYTCIVSHIILSKKNQEEYSQAIKLNNVVERFSFDWCDFIGMQITVKYKKIYKSILEILILYVVVFQRNILNKV